MGKFSNVMGTLYSYFNGFLPAYIENQVPEGATFPYITYSIAFENEFEDNLIQARIWTKENSTTDLRKYSDLIADDIGYGKIVNCKEGGNLWLKAGSPFMQFVSDEDITIKSNYINIITNFLI